MIPVGNCEAASQDDMSNLKLMMRGCGLIGGSGAAEAPVRISKRQLYGPPGQALRRRSRWHHRVISLREFALK